MIESLIQKQIDAGIMKEEDRSVYCYGYALVLEMLVNFIIAAAIGIIINKVVMILVFLLAFIPLRSFAGGYHADKGWKCVLLSNSVILLAILAVEYISLIIFPWLILVEIILGVIILRTAPVQSIHKPLNSFEVSQYKKIVIILYITQVLIEIIISLFGYRDIASVILITHTIITITLMIGKYYKSN